MNELLLGIVSDEVSSDFADSLRHARMWGIRRFEIRCLKSGRVPDVDQAEWEQVVRLSTEAAVQITALSPGIFKYPLSKTTEIERELTEVLPKTIEMAKTVNAGMVIAFGFCREPGEPPEFRDRAVDFLRRAAAIVERSRMRLAIENEPGFWCDTGTNTMAIMREVNSKALGVNWDPCNAFGTTELPYPDGYNAVRDAVFNVHVKDTKRGSLIECVPVGDGVIDWKGQIEALIRDRIVEHVTIETHCHPLVENSARNVAAVNQLIKGAHR